MWVIHFVGQKDTASVINLCIPMSESGEVEDNDNFIESNVVYVYYHKTAMQSKKPLQDNASHKASINQSPYVSWQMSCIKHT